MKQLMLCHGMTNSSYIATNYLFSYLYYSIIAILFWIFGALIGLRLFTQTNFITVFLFLFAWGHALISLAFLFATFINSKRVAVIIGYLVALMGSMIGFVCFSIFLLFLNF